MIKRENNKNLAKDFNKKKENRRKYPFLGSIKKILFKNHNFSWWENKQLGKYDINKFIKIYFGKEDGKPKIWQKTTGLSTSNLKLPEDMESIND
jgi:hypothetical protein